MGEEASLPDLNERILQRPWNFSPVRPGIVFIHVDRSFDGTAVCAAANGNQKTILERRIHEFWLCSWAKFEQLDEVCFAKR